jgi:FSR family fosmidomycin resistance protein-like MFS transporter
MGWVAPTLPFVTRNLGLGLAQAGVVAGLVSIVASFTQPALGWVGDRLVSSGSWLAVSVVWTAVFTAGLGLAGHFPALALAATLGALGSAFFHPLGSAGTLRLYPEHRGKAMSLYSASGSLGFALAPLVAVPLVMSGGRMGWMLLAPVGLLGAAIIRRLAGRSLPSPSPGRSQDTAYQLATPRSGFRCLGLLQITVALRSWVLGAFATYLAWHLVEAGASPAWAAGLLAGFLLTGVGGGLAGGALADRHGVLPVLWWSGVVAVLALGAFLTLSGPVGAAGLLLAGAALQAAFPGTLVLAQELLPGRAGLASGMIGMTGGLSGLGVALTGWLADVSTMGTALAATVLALIPAILLISVLQREFLPHPPSTSVVGEPVGEETR